MNANGPLITSLQHKKTKWVTSDTCVFFAYAVTKYKLYRITYSPAAAHPKYDVR